MRPHGDIVTAVMPAAPPTGAGLSNDRCMMQPKAPFETQKRPARRASLPLPVSGKLLLLACDGLRRTLAGAGVGVGALAAHWQTFAVTQAAIAAEIHEALDVHGNLAA